MVRLCDYATVFFSYLHIDFLTFLALLTLSEPGFLDTPQGRGGLNVPTGERWPVMASEATAEAKNRKNIVPDTFLYL